MLTRRQFIKLSAAGTAGLALALKGGALLDLALAGAPPPPQTFRPGTERAYPFLEVSGSPFAIGEQIGKQFGPSFLVTLKRRAEWFKPLKEWAEGEGKAHVEKMLAMGKKYTPAAAEELAGWARGADMEFMDLFVLNIKSEIEAFIDSRCGCAGCTTIVLKDGDRLIVTHNEDGHKAYEDSMFVLKVKPESGTNFVGFAYPGIMEGNAPWVNRHGILMTTNYIPSEKVVPGIPRYFLDRTACEASTVDEVLKLVTHPERGYAYHHVVASLADRKAYSVEANPEKTAVKELDGLFFHTNHLVWDELKDEPQFQKYMKISSIPRYDSVKRELGGKKVSEIDRKAILGALTSHAGKPWSVCRHPTDKASGATLGTAVFEASADSSASGYAYSLYRNQPCKGLVTQYQV
jgi:isopenicillin-N N-acyltransferase like protein